MRGDHAVAGVTCLPAWRASRPFYSRLETPQHTPHPFPPSTPLLEPSSSSVRRARNPSRERRCASPWPPWPRARETLSNVFLAHDSVEPPQGLEPRPREEDARLKFLLAGPVRRRRQIRRPQRIPGLAVFSISIRVSFFTFPLSSRRLFSPTADFAMEPELCRRHCRRPPRSSAPVDAAERAFGSLFSQLSNAPIPAPSRAP